MSSSSTDEPGPSAWLERITDELDALGVPWVVAGALAAQRYRDWPRFTTDLDLLVLWNPDLVERFQALGYTVTAHADPESHPHLLMLRSSEEKIDLIVAVVEYQAVALRRGQFTHYLTIEDVLIHKLLAWRLKDRDDIRSILAASSTYDEAYVAQWATEWEVLDRWERAKVGDFSG